MHFKFLVFEDSYHQQQPPSTSSYSNPFPLHPPAIIQAQQPTTLTYSNPFPLHPPAIIQPQQPTTSTYSNPFPLGPPSKSNTISTFLPSPRALQCSLPSQSHSPPFLSTSSSSSSTYEETLIQMVQDRPALYNIKLPFLERTTLKKKNMGRNRKTYGNTGGRTEGQMEVFKRSILKSQK